MLYPNQTSKNKFQETNFKKFSNTNKFSTLYFLSLVILASATKMVEKKKDYESVEKSLKSNNHPNHNKVRDNDMHLLTFLFIIFTSQFSLALFSNKQFEKLE